MESSTLRTNIEIHRLECPDQWAISVASAPALAAREIALGSRLPHRQIRVSQVGRIRSVGFDVLQSGCPPHADLVFATEPTEEDFEALRSVFAEPQPNPRVEEQR